MSGQQQIPNQTFAVISMVNRLLVWGLIVALALAAGFLIGAHHYQECVLVTTEGRYTIL